MRYSVPHPVTWPSTVAPGESCRHYLNAPVTNYPVTDINRTNLCIKNVKYRPVRASGCACATTHLVTHFRSQIWSRYFLEEHRATFEGTWSHLRYLALLPEESEAIFGGSRGVTPGHLTSEGTRSHFRRNHEPFLEEPGAI